MVRCESKKVVRRKVLKVLISAGPTREYLDPVRYISNDSSGKMGFALAAAAKALGFSVTLIVGPVAIKTPVGVKRCDVVSADEMHREMIKRSKSADIIIMAAAVADWKVRQKSKQKIKKSGAESRTLELIDNPDILKELGRIRRSGQIIVGFALETEQLEKNGMKKLIAKGCDWIVANSESTIGADKAQAILLGRGGERVVLPKVVKEKIAKAIFREILK